MREREREGEGETEIERERGREIERNHGAKLIEIKESITIDQ